MLHTCAVETNQGSVNRHAWFVVRKTKRVRNRANCTLIKAAKRYNRGGYLAINLSKEIDLNKTERKKRSSCIKFFQFFYFSIIICSLV